MNEEMKIEKKAKPKPLTRQEKIEVKKRIKELEETKRAFEYDLGVVTNLNYLPAQMTHLKNRIKSDVSKVRMQIDSLGVHINALKEKLKGK